MPASYQLIFRVAFEHMFFADGQLHDLRVAPVAACQAMLNRAGVLLRPEGNGIAAYGDAAVVERLRLHLAEACGALELAFQVRFSDPHFFDYTAPAWPPGQVLFLDTACCTTDEDGRQMLHATPCVPASAFLPRDHASLTCIRDVRTAAPAMVLQVTVSDRLLDTPVPAQRQFHVRFDAAGSHWKYILFGAPADGAARVVDLAGDIAFEYLPNVDIADRRRADVFLSTRAIPMREVQAVRFQLRAATADGDKVLIKRMPHAGVGTRCRDSRDGHEILVSEIFINH